MSLNEMLGVLSRAEREVFQHLFTNKTVTEIAKQLNVSNKAVSAHCYSIFKKVHVRSRVDLMSKFVDLKKTNQDLVSLIFSLKQDVEEMKSRLPKLPGGSRV